MFLFCIDYFMGCYYIHRVFLLSHLMLYNPTSYFYFIMISTLSVVKWTILCHWIFFRFVLLCLGCVSEFSWFYDINLIISWGVQNTREHHHHRAWITSNWNLFLYTWEIAICILCHFFFVICHSTSNVKCCCANANNKLHVKREQESKGIFFSSKKWNIHKFSMNTQMDLIYKIEWNRKRRRKKRNILQTH